MKLTLVVMSTGKNEGHNIPINLPEFLIGRDPECQIRPASPMISKKHCAVLQRSEKAYVKDFGSTNGTFVNDEQVEGEHELKNDDILKVGPLTFRVSLQASVTVDKPTPLPATLKKAPAAPVAKAPAAAAAKTPTPPPATKGAVPAKSSPAAKPAPAPQPKPAAGPEPTEDDTLHASVAPQGEDDIAALLLSLQDESGAISEEIPGGTTMMEIPAIPPEGVPPPGSPTPSAAEEKKKDPPKNEQKARTSDAAAAILQKYARRPRNG